MLFLFEISINDCNNLWANGVILPSCFLPGRSVRLFYLSSSVSFRSIHERICTYQSWESLRSASNIHIYIYIMHANVFLLRFIARFAILLLVFHCSALQFEFLILWLVHVSFSTLYREKKRTLADRGSRWSVCRSNKKRAAFLVLYLWTRGIKICMCDTLRLRYQLLQDFYGHEISFLKLLLKSITNLYSK